MIILAIEIPAFANSFNRDWFPTFDIIPMMRTSEKYPVHTTDSTLYLKEFYGKNIGNLIEVLDVPDKVAAKLYYGEYHNKFGGIPTNVNSSIDLYVLDEIGIKIYYWQQYNLYVFCVRDGHEFKSYPCGITAYYSNTWGLGEEQECPLEKWLATQTGNSGWRILSWWIDPIVYDGTNPFSRYHHPMFPHTVMMHKYEKPLINNSDIQLYNNIPDSMEFLRQYIWDSFTIFYFNTLEIGEYICKETPAVRLGNLAGIRYPDFLQLYQKPETETVITDITDNATGFDRLWVLQKLIGLDDTTSTILRKCSYRNGTFWDDTFRLNLYFIREDGYIFNKTEKSELSVERFHKIDELLKEEDKWRLIYADVIPDDPEYFPCIE